MPCFTGQARVLREELRLFLGSFPLTAQSRKALHILVVPIRMVSHLALAARGRPWGFHGSKCMCAQEFSISWEAGSWPGTRFSKPKCLMDMEGSCCLKPTQAQAS